MKNYFQNDDLSLANLEVVITDGTLKVSGEGYSFCVPQYVGEQIIDVGLDKNKRNFILIPYKEYSKEY